MNTDCINVRIYAIYLLQQVKVVEIMNIAQTALRKAYLLDVTRDNHGHKIHDQQERT